jgi:hypothetical protein
MANLNQNNFNIWWNPNDWFQTVQKNFHRNGELGEISDKEKERAYKQYQMHDFTQLADNQDSWINPDPFAGSPGREKNRNFNRMEYDFQPRYDGKGQDTVLDEVYLKQQMTVQTILDAFKKQGYTLSTAASAIGYEPIVKDDYKGQRTVDQ